MLCCYPVALTIGIHSPTTLIIVSIFKWFIYPLCVRDKNWLLCSVFRKSSSFRTKQKKRRKTATEEKFNNILKTEEERR